MSWNEIKLWIESLQRNFSPPSPHYNTPQDCVIVTNSLWCHCNMQQDLLSLVVGYIITRYRNKSILTSSLAQRHVISVGFSHSIPFQKWDFFCAKEELKGVHLYLRMSGLVARLVLWFGINFSISTIDKY